MIRDSDLLLLEQYRDGTLDGPGAERLLDLLADPASASAVHRRLAFSGELSAALAGDPEGGLATAVLRRIDAPAARDAERPRRWPMAAAIAAGLAGLTLAAWLVADGGRDRGIRMTPVGDAVVVREGRRLISAGGEALRPGDQLVADAPLALALADGSHLDLDPGTRIRLPATAGGEALRLEAGAIAADLAPQETPWRCTAADAAIEVVGTRFRLAVHDGRAVLDVFHGAVRMVDADGPRLVHAGASATSRGRTASWLPLFPDGGLEDWQLRDGAWSTAGGIIRGQAGDTAPARIQSVADHRDLDLRCRLRISGANRCEIQLGGYNWFFAIPAGSRDRDGWISVQIAQRGRRATCQADDADIPMEVAEQTEPRSGPLGFYAPIGAVLEIADAQYREVR